MFCNRFISHLRTLPLVALLLLLAACASSIEKKMTFWVGHHQAELIASWGPPSRTASDGKGGSILIYEKYVNLGQAPGKATADSAGNVKYTAPTQQGYTRTRMFYVNANGIIYHWRWQGL